MIKIPILLKSTATKTYSIYEAAKCEYDEFINASGVRNAKFIGKGKTEKWLNLPVAFDIETTSFLDDHGDKAATMYEWTFGIDDTIIIGRTWTEYAALLNRLIKVLELDKTRRIVIYVHNLAFEFQFMRFMHEWKKVFATDERKVLYAKAETAFIYRCSYFLSGMNLALLADSIGSVSKMKGDLVYTLHRHSETPLTVKELRYCVHDVLIVLEYIRQCIEREKGYITRIPLTKTGYVRRYCKEQCYFGGGRHYHNRQFGEYGKIMQKLQITGEDEYKQLKRAFQGGFTHTNAWYSGKTLTNVNSQDFNSSYPAVMVTCQFPMSAAEKVEITSVDDLKYNLKYYCCLFDAKLTGVRSRPGIPDHILSRSKCFCVEHARVDNGRIADADLLVTTFTDMDFKTFCKFYTYKSLQVFNFRRYERGYLPTPLVKAILKLYHDKTTLKGVEGKEDQYRLSKELLNSCYGMMVTDFAKPEQVYDNETGEWSVKELDLEKSIKTYNNSKNRFLFYPWGVWVTAHARQRLFAGIREYGEEDYIYADTDSIKGLHVERHEPYLQRYNAFVVKSIQRAAEYHKIPEDMFMPVTANGKRKIIGVWDNEGNYDVFRSLGAKRYMTLKYGKLSITVSGLNKQAAVPYMISQWGKYGAFQHFAEDLYVPAEFTGKNTHTYIDVPKAGVLTDYTGRSARYAEYSGVHLSGADYTLSLADEYARFLLNLREVIL